MLIKPTSANDIKSVLLRLFVVASNRAARSRICPGDSVTTGNDCDRHADCICSSMEVMTFSAELLLQELLRPMHFLGHIAG
jgi:hypothetical protein